MTRIHRLNDSPQRGSLTETVLVTTQYIWDRDKFPPSVDQMEPQELEYLDWVTKELDGGRYPDVQGREGYLLAYAQSLFARLETSTPRHLFERLIELSEAYPSEKKFGFSGYCKIWAGDCFVLEENYERFLEYSEPSEPFQTDTHRSNLRCNVSYHLGLPASTIDLLRISDASFSKYTKNYPVEFVDVADTMLQEVADKQGPWLERMARADNYRDYPHSLFQGTSRECWWKIDGSRGRDTQPRFKPPFHCFYVATSRLREVIREAENELRRRHGIPEIGEGWIAETNLYREIHKAFPQTEVLQHGRPPWLGRQHFDVWLPVWRIAIEYHGAQHFKPIDFFGGEDGFKATQKRDERKIALCSENNVTLIAVTEETPIADVIRGIDEQLKTTRSIDREEMDRSY